MSFSEADHKLSMRISPRARDGKEEQRVMRSLLVHRLRVAPKAVLRLSNSRDPATADPEDYSMFCEPCGRFFRKPDWEDDWLCPQCGTLYVTELVIMLAVPPDVDVEFARQADEVIKHNDGLMRKLAAQEIGEIDT